VSKAFYFDRDYADTVQSLIARTAQLYGKHPFCEYVEGGKNVVKSYQNMMDDVQRIEAYLAEAGVRHVGLLGATSYQWLCVFMACLYSGIVVVPMDTLLSSEDLLYQIRHSDTELLFCDEKFGNLSEELTQEDKCKKLCYLDTLGESSLAQELSTRLVRPCENAPSTVIPGLTRNLDQQFKIPGQAHNDVFTQSVVAQAAEPAAVDKRDLAMIVYTSGTTGVPKGVMLSQENLAAAAHYGSAVVDTPLVSRLLVILPNNHVFTIGHCFLTPLYFGGSLCLNDSILNTFTNLTKYKVDFLVVVPAVMRIFKQQIENQLNEAGVGPLESLGKIKLALVTKAIRAKIGPNLKSVVCGGAPLDPALVHYFKLLDIQLQSGYGMTECAPLISCQVKDHIDYDRADSVGVPGVCIDAKIIDGEIQVSGKNVMLGYYKDPQSTAEVLVDGWLKTGDLGYLDDEGFLYVTGRRKNLIILGNGENVSPEELEMLFDDCTYIDSMIVYPNVELDIICAEIYPDEKAVEKLGLEKVQELIRDVVKEVNQKLPIYKNIKLVNFRDTPFEKTTTLKIKR